MKRDLNLLPDSIKKARVSRERTRLIIMLCILVAVSCYAFIQAFYLNIAEYKKRKVDLEQRIAAMKDVEALEKSLAAEKAKLTPMQNVLQTAGAGNEEMYFAFQQIEKIMPKDLFFATVNVSKDKLTIEGAARSDKAVADFIRSMKETGRFESVFVSSISSNSSSANDGKQDEQKKFSMSCIFKSQ